MMNPSDKSREQQLDDGPWYKQFWAWFVLTPLLVIMLAWIPFMTIVLKDADDVVIDNYYKEGRMINMRVDEDRAAAALGLNGELFFDQLVGDVVLTLSSTDVNYQWPSTLELHMDHPLEEDNDHVIILHQIVDGRYRGELQQKVANHWYLRLMPATEPAQGTQVVLAEGEALPQWRIVTEMDFSKGSQLTFGKHE